MTINAPSRICLFGEHQDYLGLEVIVAAIDLHFTAQIENGTGTNIDITIRDSSVNRLLDTNAEGKYKQLTIDYAQPIEYENKRDYLRSSVNILLKNGYKLKPLGIKLDSDIPIGKGMCSSSTMIVSLIKAILAGIGHADLDDPRRIARLAFDAEVTEFGEPGGMMDHYASALRGLLHLDFADADNTVVGPIPKQIDGVFVIADSLDQKDTTRILAESKFPTLSALAMLEPFGITSVKDFANDTNLRYLDELDTFHRRKLSANISNYKLLCEAKAMLFGDSFDAVRFGQLISAHHANLRDGLGISTNKIDAILDTAIKHGAYGGKVNGSGGGGCCYAYAPADKAEGIIAAITAMGYPAKLLNIVY